MKNKVKKIEIIRKLAFLRNFYRKNGYIPSVEKPKTFNEKILHRKKYSNAKEFSKYADKVAVKEYIENTIGKDIVIPSLYVNEGLSVEKISSLLKDNKSVVVKANHNSGPIYVIDDDVCPESLETIVGNINSQLKGDYGKLKQELWYSHIQRKVLIEKRLYPESGDNDLKDYKFHVFKQKDGSQKVVLHIDFDRNTNHTRSFYDEDFNWLPFSMAHATIKTNLVKPKNYSSMLEIAKKIAGPFSYVRVDLYNLDGKIYFGEMTFAHGSGSEPFTSYFYDEWMGALWETND